MAGIDEIDWASEAARQHVPRQCVADRARFIAGADDRDRTGLKGMFEVADRHAAFSGDAMLGPSAKATSTTVIYSSAIHCFWAGFNSRLRGNKLKEELTQADYGSGHPIDCDSMM